jgi:NAD(P)-dependent dehydrogenase (short-subunit alcohol dehydrogenase family)
MTNLTNKVAVVFAGGGDIARAVAQSLKEHGATVYVAERAQVDALNENQIDGFIQKVVAEQGRLDIVFNGIGVSYEEMGGRPATTEASLAHFLAPMEKICGSQFLTSRVAARYMVETGSEGTVLLLTAALSRSKLPNVAGITAASAAIEGMTRVMAAEWGQHHIKVMCLCPGALMETRRISGWIKGAAEQYHMPVEQLVAQYQAFDILKGSPTLKQLGDTAAFLASDAGAAFNSHVVDVDGGKLNIL